jgi:hypothetical protein
MLLLHDRVWPEPLFEDPAGQNMAPPIRLAMRYNDAILNDPVVYHPLKCQLCTSKKHTS